MSSLMLGWILLAGAVSIESVINKHGTVGGTVTFTCSHMYAHDNIKYFCKDPCSEENILIKSDQTPRGRFTLKDLGNGHFDVSINDLQISDSGTYKCGVDRSFFIDTYTEVRLTVKYATPPAPPRTSTSTTTSTRIRTSSPPQSSIQTVRATISNSIHQPTKSTRREPAAGLLLYTAAGLVGLIMVLLVSLIVCCRTKKRRDSEQKISSVYEDVKKHPTEERKPSGTVRRASSAECMYGNVLLLEDIKHSDNPLYDTREPNMTIYSTVN